MLKEKLKDILSLNGISILIGVVGGIWGLLSIFIDWNWQVSIKWLALVLILCMFIVLILSLLINKLNNAYNERVNHKIRIINYLPEQSLLLVDNCDSLEYFQIVSLFFVKDGFEIRMAYGYVETKNLFAQIKIIQFENEFMEEYPDEYQRIIEKNKESLESISIKNYYKYDG
ncbi:MAG: hypothetical protein FGM14_12520 [Flavobacteriales bacterium]|nr:hypothetical protein [Flavobacteriales bacterium]